MPGRSCQDERARSIGPGRSNWHERARSIELSQARQVDQSGTSQVDRPGSSEPGRSPARPAKPKVLAKPFSPVPARTSSWHVRAGLAWRCELPLRGELVVRAGPVSWPCVHGAATKLVSWVSAVGQHRYIYIYIHIYTHTHIYTCAHTRTYTHVRTHAIAHACPYTRA